MIGTERKPAIVSPATAKSSPAAKSILARFGSILCGIIAAALCLCVTFALVEFVFSLAHVGEDTVVKPDPLLGFFHLENKAVTARIEGYSRSQINSLGFRDRIYAVPKPAGTTRIAVVGDSMTVGMEVPLENTFAKLLEKHYRQQGKNVEVLNCGITGTGTGQQYLGYLQKIAPLQPDMLIVAYHLGDTDDNVGGGTNPPRPTFMLDSKQQLRVDFHDVDAWLASEHSRFYSSFDWLRRNSRVLAVLNKLALDLSADPVYKRLIHPIEKPIASLWSRYLKTLPQGDWHVTTARQQVSDMLLEPEKISVPAKISESKAASKAPANKPAVIAEAVDQKTLQADASGATSSSTAAPSVAAAPPAPVIENGQQDITLLRGILAIHQSRVAVTKEIVRRLNAACRERHCQLVIAAMPANDNSAIYYREVKALRELAAVEHFQFIDSWTSFPPRAPMSESPYHYISHFNSAGHALMCKTITEKLVFNSIP